MSKQQSSSDKRPSPPGPGSSLVNLTVKNQKDQTRIFFRIRRDSQIKKLLTAYCDKKFLPYGSFHFLINGKRFADNKTPDELGLKNDDEIHAFVPVDGGGAGSSAAMIGCSRQP